MKFLNNKNMSAPVWGTYKNIKNKEKGDEKIRRVLNLKIAQKLKIGFQQSFSMQINETPYKRTI